MKNKCNVPLVRLFGIIAIVAVIGFSFAACDDGNGDNGGGGNTGGGDPTWTFTFNFVDFENNPEIDFYLRAIPLNHKDGQENVFQKQAAGIDDVFFVVRQRGNTNAFNPDNITVSISPTLHDPIEVYKPEDYMYSRIPNKPQDILNSNAYYYAFIGGIPSHSYVFTVTYHD